ncbi:MAG: LysR family transcriptional regulator, partial [Candidimonas sp.]
MRSEWIEDLLTLVQHPNFSQAAAARCVTQPAFSRRIQMLETWVGAELIDRRARPLRLTPAGERHAHEFREILNRLETLRAKIRSDASGIVEFRMATQHSLAITRLPSLIEALAQHVDEYRVEIAIRSNARDDCVDQFTRGEVDLMLCLEESDNLLKNRLPWAGRLPVGSEALVPVS